MENNDLLKSDKDELRSLYIEKAKAMNPADRNVADKRINQRLIDAPEFRAAEDIFTFVGVGHEIDTCLFIEHALKTCKRVYVPHCLGNGVMVAARLNSFSELRPGMYGIPSVSEENPVIEPREVDLIIVPAVCYDRHGNRLGRGGGYYDRYLKSVSEDTVSIGVCRSPQLLDNIRVMQHDMRVDIVITDREVLRIK